MRKMKSVLGPAAPGGYVQATGIVIPFGEFERILSAEAVCDNSDILVVNDIIYSLRVTFTTPPAAPAVVIHVWFADTSGAGPNAWTELAGATPLDARTFTALVDAE